MKFLVLLCLLALLNHCGGVSSVATFQASVTINTSLGSFPIQVEIADSSSERETGLMFRTDLSDSQGMLFIWPQETTPSFWMKDTPLSLDILFINNSYEIVYIAEGAVPYSLDMITPDQPIRYVLEVKAGFIGRTGLVVGDHITFSL